MKLSLVIVENSTLFTFILLKMACENPRSIRNPVYKGMNDDEAYEFFSSRYEDVSIDWNKHQFTTPFDLYIEVPCGCCASCQRRRLNGYRIRLLSELSRWSRNAFVTLTFNDSYLKYLDDHCNSDYNKPVRQFLDNLRKKYGKGIRHWFVCEFGKLHGRPHYHGILFNLPEHLTADDIIDSWNRHRQGSRKNKKDQWDFGPSDRGICYVGNECSSKTAHYITKYLTKEWSFGRTVPRVISSKGLGENYCTPEQIAAHHRDGLKPYISTSNDYVVPLPRFLATRIFSKQDMRQLSANRAISPFFIFNGKQFPTAEALRLYRHNVFERNVRLGLSLRENPHKLSRRSSYKKKQELFEFASLTSSIKF